MRNVFSVCSLLLAVVLFPLAGYSQIGETKNLSTLMGALDKIVDENTQIKGFNEAPTRLTPTAEQAADDIANELEDCQTTKSTEPELVVVEEDGVSSEFKVYDIKIFGERCPVEMTSAIITKEQTPKKFEGGFKMSIVFKAEAFIQKYRARHIEASGIIKAYTTKKGSTVTLPVSIEITASGDSLDLGLFTQKIGMTATTAVNTANFGFSMAIEQNAAMKYGQVDQKGYAMMKMSGFSAPQQVFKINDKNVSESEFQTFIQSFIVPGMVEEEDPETPDDRRPTSCKVVAYDKQAITEAELKLALLKPVLPTQGQLVKSESCMKNQTVSFKKGTDDLNGLLDFQTEWISFNVQNSSTKKSAGDVFVLYGDYAPQTSQTDTMVLGLKCESVPMCF